MSKPIVFLGPTLSAAEASRYLDATYLPPVAQGDVHRAALRSPPAIGIVDGYFAQVPSVWHKEILWAMSEGIWVFGSASMGALRAAELAPFGMVGVGRVFEQFLRGELEDDDEVAVAHAPAADGFRAQSEAMVNLRATLAAANQARVIGKRTCAALLSVGKGLPFGERSARRIVLEARKQRLGSDAELDRLERWLPRGAVDLKRLDALGMLIAMKELLQAAPGPPETDYVLEWTDAWETARLRSLDVVQDHTAFAAPRGELWEEVLVAGLARQVSESAMARALSQEQRAGIQAESDQAALNEVARTFRRERGLEDPRHFADWLAREELNSSPEVDDFFRRELSHRRIQILKQQAATSQVPDVLRNLGRYGELSSRARVKNAILAEKGSAFPASRLPDDAGLWRWYFREVENRDPPADLEAYASANGFESEAALRAAVQRELMFRYWTGERG